MQLAQEGKVAELKRQMLFAAGPLTARQHGYSVALLRFAVEMLNDEQMKALGEFAINIFSECDDEVQL